MTKDSGLRTQDSVQNIKIIECPRDAMQGISHFIPTGKKAAYINSLLRIGFDTIDFGSFVSPKAIPQMRDTAEVLEQLDLERSKSRLLAIVANLRGAQEAALHPQISYLGFPLSLSETFQKRNTNKSIEDAFQVVEQINNLCRKNGKTLVVYLSMGFGNPYGDPYDSGVPEAFVEKLHKTGVEIVSLSDTIASAGPEEIEKIFSHVSSRYPHIELGLHLHTQQHEAREKVDAAYKAGCRRIDGALLGFGGCPMAKDELTGNLPTEEIVRYLADKQLPSGINMHALQQSILLAREIFY